MPTPDRRSTTRAGGVFLSVLLLAAAGEPVSAQNPRERTRPKPDRSTSVTERQATELTLTLTTVEVRQIQIWVRTSAVTSDQGRTLRAVLSRAEGAHVAVGQRVRAFPPESRSSMYQARVTQVAPDGDRVRLAVQLAGPGRDGSRHYVLEIVTEAGDFLSIPNEAIIETGETPLVYVQEAEGRYVPREVRLGVQGELYTEVLDGLQPGEQVATFGSFFIDAEHKLKGS